MRAEFYPNAAKTDFERLGCVARRSAHSRGSTVDLAPTGPAAPPRRDWKPGDTLTACTADFGIRYPDGTLDMGTGFDCFDEQSHPAASAITAEARRNRDTLSNVMAKHGFSGIDSEWWHFTLRDEPFPKRSFDFNTRGR